MKIGQFEWSKAQDRPDIPASFDVLDDRFFSLGQDVSYYSDIAALGDMTAQQLFLALRDVVFDHALFNRAAAERVVAHADCAASIY